MNDGQRTQVVPLLHRRLSTGPTLPPYQIPITLRARPVLFISTFLVLHQSLTTLSLLPAYGYFHLTDSSTTFLLGPYATFLLHQPLPFSRGERTVEDLVDTVLRRSVKTGWRLWGKWKGRKVDEAEGNEIAEEVLQELEGKKRWRDRVTERAAVWKDGRSERESTVTAKLNKLREWKEAQLERGRGMELNDVIERKSSTLKTITDVAAAYLVVKVIFPLRLAASLFFAPRLARAFARRL